MPDNISEDNGVPGNDLPGDGMTPGENRMIPSGPSKEKAGEDQPPIGDEMSARQSIPPKRIMPDPDLLARQSAQREIREATGTAPGGIAARGETTPAAPPVSIMRKRFRKFKSLKRGYISFILLVVLYILSFLLPILINSKPLVVHYNGEYSFPALASLLPFSKSFYPGSKFGQAGSQATNFHQLKKDLAASSGDNWVMMPVYPWDPYESDFQSVEPPPNPPSQLHIFGTDNTGRDVFARMCYGFNVSISFALILTFVNFLVGTALGGLMGYYGGKFDLISQRLIEVWSNIPFLYTVIIISSILIPNFWLLIVVLSVFGWIGMSYLMRGEFLREKNKDYVSAAISLGATDGQIIFKHILPNSLTPLIASLPFSVIGGITTLVGLDYLGFGIPPPTSSWGQMVQIGMENLEHWWLVVVPLSAMFLTLLLVTFIGEGIREAFDPKVFSRLR